MDGFFIIDKPVGLTSHDVVSRVRKILGTKKVGHTGTLDPFATGVLPVAVGSGTKIIQFLDESMKVYEATMRLGMVTDTQDCTGSTLSQKEYRQIDRLTLQGVLDGFVGRSRQIPPMYSAVKIGGIPLYRQARQGLEIERPSREICIHSLEMRSLELPWVSFSVSCSRGTYVRTLANDIGDRLGCGAHLTSLRRTRSGCFLIEASLGLDELAGIAQGGQLDDRLISPGTALSHLKDLQLSEAGEWKVCHGMLPEEGELLEIPSHGFLTGEKLRLSRGAGLRAIVEMVSDQGDEFRQNARLLRVFC